MIDLQVKKSLIYDNFSNSDKEYWFSLKKDKFLHNIDTFYYSCILDNDFTSSSEDYSVINFRNFIHQFDDVNRDEIIPFDLPLSDVQLNIRRFIFGSFYKIDFECPELFDIFFADNVPTNRSGDNVTPQVIVQLRSQYLWEVGAALAVRKSIDVLKSLCSYFGFKILELKENRVDYCWHSNYLQNPSEFFRIDNFVKMKVCSFKRIQYEYQFKPCDEYEGDYIALGKRSDKCFVRIYLKSKEVVEMGYKSFFFYIWLFHGLINRYDLFVYEECFRKRSWKHLDLARINFYLDYGSDEFYKLQCRNILDNPDRVSDIEIKRLADKLTPKVTLVTNVEFQTMRKASRSFVLKIFKDNEKEGPAKRIFDYLDNRKLITDYLTHSTLRLVEPYDSDLNKSRRDYCRFWKSLRSCKQVDVFLPPKDLKLCRDYSRNLNSDLVKTRMLNSAIVFSLYVNGKNFDIDDESLYKDVYGSMLMMNDNDLRKLKNYKYKKSLSLSDDKCGSINVCISDSCNYSVFNKESGEVFI